MGSPFLKVNQIKLSVKSFLIFFQNIFFTKKFLTQLFFILQEFNLFEIEKIEVDGKILHGMKSTLPDVPPLLLIKGSKGFVMCGYLNMEVAERLGATAAMVSGVKSFDDVLNAQIKSATTKGKQIGLEPGKTVRDVIVAIS